MADIVVTVPMNFTDANTTGAKGLAAWIGEGDAAGTEWSGMEWEFSVAGPRPPCKPGDRVYIVCEYLLRGYAPLVRVDELGPRYWGLIRGGDAVAVTVPFEITGFRGWRLRWWDRRVEVPFPDWQTAKRKAGVR